MVHPSGGIRLGTPACPRHQPLRPPRVFGASLDLPTARLPPESSVVTRIASRS